MSPRGCTQFGYNQKKLDENAIIYQSEMIMKSPSFTSFYDLL